MGKALKFKQHQTPKQAGEVARLKVTQGPDQGSLYVLTNLPASIGRGDECDVQIADIHASRKHAEIQRDKTGWKIQDLGSQNGIVHNGKVLREANLKMGDTVSVGATVFEFVPSEANAMALMAPGRSLSSANALGVLTTIPKEVPRVPPVSHGLSGLAGISQSGSSSGGNAQQKRMLIIVAVGAAAYFYLDSTEKKPTPKPVATKPVTQQTLRAPSSLNTGQFPGLKTSEAEVFFREGFREFREKNYLRAKTQFDTALQINPGHYLSQFYLKAAEKAISDEVTTHLRIGKKDMDVGKLKSAKGHFESVMRLLYMDQTDPHYIEAEDHLKMVEGAMKGGAAG